MMQFRVTGNKNSFFFNGRKNATSFEKFHLGISRMEMYKESDSIVHELLQDMATDEIVHMGE